MIKEWAEGHGLTAFHSPEYDSALEAVSRRLGVTSGGALAQHYGGQAMQSTGAGTAGEFQCSAVKVTLQCDVSC